MASDRLHREGHRTLPRSGRRSSLRIDLDTVREPMFAFLLAAGLLYLALGDHLEAVLPFALATLSVVIAIGQKMQTERTLDAIRYLSNPCATVIRAGTRRRIPGRDVVRGGLLVVTEGDRVRADALLLSATGQEIDDFLLTGNSYPCAKRRAGKHRGFGRAGCGG